MAPPRPEITLSVNHRQPNCHHAAGHSVQHREVPSGPPPSAWPSCPHWPGLRGWQPAAWQRQPLPRQDPGLLAGGLPCCLYPAASRPQEDRPAGQRCCWSTAAQHLRITDRTVSRSASHDAGLQPVQRRSSANSHLHSSQLALKGQLWQGACMRHAACYVGKRLGQADLAQPGTQYRPRLPALGASRGLPHARRHQPRWSPAYHQRPAPPWHLQQSSWLRSTHVLAMVNMSCCSWRLHFAHQCVHASQATGQCSSKLVPLVAQSHLPEAAASQTGPVHAPHHHAKADFWQEHCRQLAHLPQAAAPQVGCRACPWDTGTP